MQSLTTKKLALASMVGAAYFALTMLFAPISFGPVQCRISEVLCVLPFYFPSTAWGLFVGCMLSNILGGYGLLDIICGSMATLLAGLVTSKIRIKWLAPLPPVLINGLVVGAMLAYLTTPENIWAGFTILSVQIAAEQLVPCFILGIPLLLLLPRLPIFDKMQDYR